MITKNKTFKATIRTKMKTKGWYSVKLKIGTHHLFITFTPREILLKLIEGTQSKMYRLLRQSWMHQIRDSIKKVSREYHNHAAPHYFT